jgi:hypothetical protein
LLDYTITPPEWLVRKYYTVIENGKDKKFLFINDRKSHWTIWDFNNRFVKKLGFTDDEGKALTTADLAKKSKHGEIIHGLLDDVDGDDWERHLEFRGAVRGGPNQSIPDWNTVREHIYTYHVVEREDLKSDWTCTCKDARKKGVCLHLIVLNSEIRTWASNFEFFSPFSGNF